MHAIVATEGLVLAKRGRGEANTSVVLLTEKLGVIRASARSARLERSKLRYGLETLTAGTFSFVRGKHDWKLTGAEDLSRQCVGQGRGARTAAGRIARLLLRLIQGEEPVAQLYRAVMAGLTYIASADDRDIELVECLTVLRILSLLGYVHGGHALEPFLATSDVTGELLERVRTSKQTLIRAINASLSETGL